MIKKSIVSRTTGIALLLASPLAFAQVGNDAGGAETRPYQQQQQPAPTQQAPAGQDQQGQSAQSPWGEEDDNDSSETEYDNDTYNNGGGAQPHQGEMR